MTFVLFVFRWRRASQKKQKDIAGAEIVIADPVTTYPDDGSSMKVADVISEALSTSDVTCADGVTVEKDTSAATVV